MTPAPDVVRRLWEELHDVSSNERAWEIIGKYLDAACRTRPDYNLRCQDCGAPHNLDTSIPSPIWNAICENRPEVPPGAAGIGMPEVGLLCILCIDERLQKAGLTCHEAEFYFVGRALSSKLYGGPDSRGLYALLNLCRSLYARWSNTAPNSPHRMLDDYDAHALHAAIALAEPKGGESA
jgi:hypothetical protein